MQTGIAGKIEACKACNLRQQCAMPLPGDFELTEANPASLMIILTSPNKEEEVTRTPLGCREGDFLRDVLKEAKIDNYYTTHVIKCSTPSTKIRKPNIDTCKRWLWQEMKMLQPKRIVTFGQLPTNLLMQRAISKSTKELHGKKFQIDYLNDCWLHPWPSLTNIISRADSVQKFKKWTQLLGDVLCH